MMKPTVETPVAINTVDSSIGIRQIGENLKNVSSMEIAKKK